MSDAPSPDSPAGLSGEYNPIFAQLVRDQDDLEGLIAYGRYKFAKREYVENYRRQHGKAPSLETLTEYVRGWTPSRLEGLEGEARQALASFGHSVLEDKEPDIRKAAVEGRIDADLKGFQETIEQAKRKEWIGAIGYSMLASLLYTVLLIGFALVLAYAGVDLIGLAQRVRPPPS